MNIILEKYLWERIPLLGNPSQEWEMFPSDVIQQMIDLRMINSPKQAWRTLEKWQRLGLYNYGSRLDLGWREQKEFPEVPK